MNLDTFFEKFELFADAPNAVAKMRELILDLAVRGMLIPQGSNEGTATELISAIVEERSDYAKIGTSKQQAQQLVSGTFSIPVHWVWTRLGDIALQIQYGYTASADAALTDIRMLRITDIQNNRVNWPSVPGCIIENEEAERYLLSPNDILIARTGGTIGKSFLVPDAPVKSVFASYLIRVKPPRSVVARYIKIFLESPLYWSQLRAMSAGTGQPNVNGQALGRLELPLPPLAEQKRIVAKVDELMALCDRLEAQQQQRETRHTALAHASLTRFADAPTPANLELLFHKAYAIEPGELRKSILTLAVQGKLVSQDANDEAVENMLLRILEEQRLLKRTMASSIRILVAEGRLEYETPESWRWLTLEDISIFGPTNGISPKSVEYETPVRSLTLSATTSGRFKAEHCKYIPMELSTDSDLWLKDGDVLVQRGNTIDYVGVAAVYHGAPHQFVYPDLMMKIRVSSEVDVDFIHLAMSSEPSRSFLRARASGTSGSMPKINQVTLKSLPLPIPPLAEQKRIVAKVEQLMGLVDRLEAQLAESRATATALLEAVVAELSAAA